MEKFLEELKINLKELEKSTRPESKEELLKPLFDLTERGKSVEKLTDDSLVVINNLLDKHSIDPDENLMAEIRSLSADIIRQRINN